MIRKIFIGIGIFLGIILLSLLWALKPVDYTPYFKTEYYKNTHERLNQIKEKLSESKGRVMIGFGKKSITPLLKGEGDDPKKGIFPKIPLAGYGGREGAPATGIHDSLFVKTVAVQAGETTLVFVGSDLLIMPPEVSQKVTEKVSSVSNLKRNNIFFSATHTHSSVGAWSEGTVGELFGGTYNPMVVDWLSDKVSEAVLQAAEDLQPGQIGIGNFQAAEYVRNRLVGDDGVADPDFIVMIAEQSEGKKAVMGSFNAHATTLGEWNMETAADYPGYWQRKLEKNGFDLAVFYAGSVGSHSYISQGEKFEKSQYIGEALADSTFVCSQKIEMKDTIELSSMTLEIEIPEFQVRITDGLRLNPTLAKSLFPAVGDVYLQAAKIDRLIWATAPSDFSGETTIIYKNALAKKGYRAMVSSFNGAYTGYIIPCKYYHLDAYESRLMNWFGPSYNPYINYLLGEMMQAFTSDTAGS